MDQQRDELLATANRVARHPETRRQLENRRPLLAQDRAVYARIRAYGSDALISLYVRLRVVALGLWRDVLALWGAQIWFHASYAVFGDQSAECDLDARRGLVGAR
jgi:hypothetical protein